MKVRMLRFISGTRNGAYYPEPGEVMDLGPDDDGADLTRNGYAEALEPTKAERAKALETTAMLPSENTAKVAKPKARPARKREEG